MRNVNAIKIICTCILLVALLPTKMFGRGRGGSYNLIGVAVASNGDTLRNQKLLYYYKGGIDTIITDAAGNYNVEVRWATACPSLGTGLQTRRSTRNYNPKYIYFSYNGIKIKVKNKWRKYLTLDYDIPQRKNLTF